MSVWTCMCVCPHAYMCMLTHICLNVRWGSGRLKLHDGGGHNMVGFSMIIFIFFFFFWWRDPTPFHHGPLERQPKRDARCRGIATAQQNEMRNQRGAERMKNEVRGGKRGWELDKRKRKWYRSALLLMLVHQSMNPKKLCGVVVPSQKEGHGRTF